MQVDGVLSVTLYAPYWMVNKTGFPLDYKASDANENTAAQHPKEGLVSCKLRRQTICEFWKHLLFVYLSDKFLNASGNKISAILDNCNWNQANLSLYQSYVTQGTKTRILLWKCLEILSKTFNAWDHKF